VIWSNHRTIRRTKEIKGVRVICFKKHKHPRAFPAAYAPNAPPLLVFVYLLEGFRDE